MGIVYVIGGLLVAFIILQLVSWGVSSAVDKSVTAADNAIRKAKEKASPSEPEKLADRFKDQPVKKSDQQEGDGQQGKGDQQEDGDQH